MDHHSKTGLPHWAQTSDRRDFLHRAANGFGALALSSLLAREASASQPASGSDVCMAPALHLQDPLAATVLFS